MNRIQIIIIGLILTLFALMAIVIFRYNLVFGETVFQKSMMAGCMHKELKSKNLSESKDLCECYIGNLVENYSENQIRNNIDQIKLEDKNLFNNCRPEKDDLAENLSIDTTKFYQKIGWKTQIDNNTIQEIEAYVSKKSDTLINQLKVYNNGVIDPTKSKFYELKIEGFKDSLIQGEISFFTPQDCTSIKNKREITLTYLQREEDSLIIREIDTDTNYIEFPYRNFDNYSFVGVISDFRWIYNDSSDSYTVYENYFAIDSEASTDNGFVELLK
ncbi:hypothetical protein ML462_15890 [Gramella lutea]|uniref:Uncharacterized protein n=1 Tax=Christiangramia lutea TaxID=1607951 RepID=A0A9X2ACN4_9FLAO|nr:hypothetical protein [Christiangramia lutea]MCH4824652.1 hypothetical protein [Christiangramia lutea]